MYFRIHTSDIAYRTQKPRGLFVAVWRLVEEGVLSYEETKEYWVQRVSFEKNLPIPPFYDDGNPSGAVTWFKDNQLGRGMFSQMDFYVKMASRYCVPLYETTASLLPGELIYEDVFQVGVTASLHDGPGFDTRLLPS